MELVTKYHQDAHNAHIKMKQYAYAILALFLATISSPVAYAFNLIGGNTTAIITVFAAIMFITMTPALIISMDYAREEQRYKLKKIRELLREA